MSHPDQKVSNVLLGKSRGQLLIAPERTKRLSQSGNKHSVVVKVKSDAVNTLYCIGTCNVRSRNQGKLDVVKQR